MDREVRCALPLAKPLLPLDEGGGRSPSPGGVVPNKVSEPRRLAVEMTAGRMLCVLCHGCPLVAVSVSGAMWWYRKVSWERRCGFVVEGANERIKSRSFEGRKPSRQRGTFEPGVLS